LSIGGLFVEWIDGIGEVVDVLIKGAVGLGSDNIKGFPFKDFEVILFTIQLESLAIAFLSLDGDIASIRRLV